MNQLMCSFSNLVLLNMELLAFRFSMVTLWHTSTKQISSIAEGFHFQIQVSSKLMALRFVIFLLVKTLIC